MSVLEVRNLKKSFGKDTVVLKGVDFSLEKGETVAIIGSSGSGKTTLLRCLNFLTVPDEGQIVVNDETLFDDADPNTQKEREIRRKRLHFGLVFQNFNLFPQYTARQNVMLASELLAKEQPDYKAHKKQIHAQIAAQAEELGADGSCVFFDKERDLSDKLAGLGRDKILKGEFSDDLTPLYLRRCQAEELLDAGKL